jgi:hypothetical protein
MIVVVGETFHLMGGTGWTEPPEVTMDSSFRRVTNDAYTNLCKVMPPTIVERESAAVVNLNYTDRCWPRNTAYRKPLVGII